MEMPEVAHLDERSNSVSLDALGDAALETWIKYPGIAEGDYVRVNWRGCRADNTADDIFGARQVLRLDPVKGWVFPIANDKVKALRGGQVFYSYMRVTDAGEPLSEESLRRAFYVQRPDEGYWSLPVPHLQDAHQGKIDASALNPEGVLLATAPYAAMSEGDEITLTWTPFYTETAEGTPVQQEYVVEEHDIGQPLLWHLEYGDVFNYLYGHGLLQYRIKYASGTSSESLVQRFEIVWPEPEPKPEPTDPPPAPPAPLLPAPRIDGHTGGALDPDDEAYQDGVWLELEVDPQMRVGDSLMLYAVGPQVTLRSLRADVSSLDGKRVAVLLDRAWLQSDENRGKQVTFSYEFARQGVQKRSQVLTVILQRKLHLPLPVIKHAVQEPGDESHQATVHPRNLGSGAEVRIPQDAELGEGEVPAPQIRLHWQGHGSTGNVIVPQPASGDQRLFRVPRSAMAANLGRRLDVYYTLTRHGEAPRESQKFDLRVADFDSASYLPIQVSGVENGQLKLSEVPTHGALCTQDSWTFMAEGQLLGIEAEGEPRTGKPPTHVLRPRTAEVTEDEYYDGSIEALLPIQFLEGLNLNSTLRLTAYASFDDGETWRAFRSADIKLVG
ncbi:hypothetical protein [Pseudomonas sp. CM27]|uniref:hypothetical protein n=1 Tax=Pseudomonas sp. CM27 TaxID=2738452 RepID=UPI0015548D99|nr:hypothetical protein [Pseudomonas sp. CM27]NQD73542.1 hypothetical protein [Pseudomonas sp. CM27]